MRLYFVWLLPGRAEAPQPPSPHQSLPEAEAASRNLPEGLPLPFLHGGRCLPLTGSWWETLAGQAGAALERGHEGDTFGAGRAVVSTRPGCAQGQCHGPAVSRGLPRCPSPVGSTRQGTAQEGLLGAVTNPGKRHGEQGVTSQQPHGLPNQPATNPGPTRARDVPEQIFQMCATECFRQGGAAILPTAKSGSSSG